MARATNAGPSCSGRHPGVWFDVLESRLLWSAASFAAAPVPAAPAAGVSVAADTLPLVTGLRASDVTTHSVTLAWDPTTYNDSDPENSYRVYERDADGTWTLAASPGLAAGVAFGNLAPGSTHTYAVTLLDSDFNESAKSAPLTVTTFAPPTLSHPDPDGVPVRAAVGMPFAYQLAAAGVPAPSLQIASGPAGVSVDAAGLVRWTPAADQAGTASITARATNAYGQADWTFTVPVAPAGADVTPPGVVTGVTASGPLRDGTGLSWDAAPDDVGVDHYRLRVYANTRPAVLLTRLDTPTAATTFTLTDPALTFNSTYGVKVTAVDAAGNESDVAATPTVVFPTALVDVTRPTAPTNVAVAGLTSGSVTLTWSPSTDDVGVAGYRIYRRYTTPRYKSPPVVHYVQFLGGIDPAARSATVTGLASGMAYTMVVEAYDAAGNTARSALVSFATAPAEVADAYVSGSAWTAAFKSYLAARPGGRGDSALYGWRVTDSTAASAPLPFVNLDTVALRFNGTVPAAVNATNVLATLDGAPLSVQSVGRDPADATMALVRFGRALGAGLLNVQIPGVLMAAGHPLDMAVPLRPGDVDGSGAVTAADFFAARSHVGRVGPVPGTATGGYDPLYDVDGSGAVTASDLLLVRLRGRVV